MEQRLGNIIIHPSGGTAGQNANTYKLTLPSAWMKELGITPEDRQVELRFNGTSIIISKRLALAEFTEQKRQQGHTLMHIFYYDGETLCTRIAVDCTDQTLVVENDVSNVIKTAFGRNEMPTWADLQSFLEERCIPRGRAGLREYLETIGIEEYDPLAIIEKTSGRMAEDDQWLNVEVLK